MWTSFMQSLSSSMLLINLVYNTARTCLAPFLASYLQLGGRTFLEDDTTAKSKTLCVREVPLLILLQIAVLMMTAELKFVTVSITHMHTVFI